MPVRNGSGFSDGRRETSPVSESRKSDSDNEAMTGTSAKKIQDSGINMTLKPDAGWETNIGKSAWGIDVVAWNKIKNLSEEIKFDFLAKLAAAPKTKKSIAMLPKLYKDAKPIKEITVFKKFEDINKEADNLVMFTKNAKENKDNLVSYARAFFCEETLKSYIEIGEINISTMKLLNSKTKELRFSLDNLVKNKIKHPEMSESDYTIIPKIIKNPSKICKSKTNKENIILLKKDKKAYMLVIKNTKDKTENYIKSFRLIGEKEYDKY